MRTESALKPETGIPPVAYQRFILANRPRLNVAREQLDEIRTGLARSRRNRTHFIEDPTSYLQAQSLPVTSCTFVQTTEAARNFQQVPIIMTTSYIVAAAVVKVDMDCLLDCHMMITASGQGTETFQLDVLPEDQRSGSFAWQQGTSIL